MQGAVPGTRDELETTARQDAYYMICKVVAYAWRRELTAMREIGRSQRLTRTGVRTMPDAHEDATSRQPRESKSIFAERAMEG